jgi:hypothetical protein
LFLFGVFKSPEDDSALVRGSAVLVISRLEEFDSGSKYWAWLLLCPSLSITNEALSKDVSSPERLLSVMTGASTTRHDSWMGLLAGGSSAAAFRGFLISKQVENDDD